MIYVETRGSWREMGEQYGEATRAVLRRAIDYFAPWLLGDPARSGRAAGALRKSILPEFPQVIEESEGMARGAGLPADAVLCLRFLGEVGAAMELGCTNVFLADSDRGPLMARNEDIEPDVSVEIQVCRTSRPCDGAASMLLTYVGFLAGVGMNEHGIGIGGSSAHAAATARPAGVPNSLVFFDLLHRAESVQQAERDWRDRPIYGKGAICVIGDASGDSRAMELLSGTPPRFIARKSGADWQICSNFYLSPDRPPANEAAYLENGYARYGRLMHCLAETPVARTADALKKLMADVAAPGLCVADKDLKLRTAYTTIMDLKHHKLLLCDGHPATGTFKELSL